MLKKYLLPVLIAALLLSGCHHTTAVILPPETTLPQEGTEPTEAVSGITTQDAALSVDSTPSETIQKTEPPTQPDPQTTPPVPETKPQNTEKPSSSSKPTAELTLPQTEPSVSTTEPDTVQTEPAETTPVETTPAETEAETQPQNPVYDISGHSVGSLEKSVLEVINGHRADAGLPELTLDKKLSALATIRAYECSVSWSSTRPDGRGWKTVLSDYSYGRRGSNAEGRLYCTQSYGAELIVDSWMYSGQKDNILSESFTHAGVGVYKANGKLYVVVLYAG